MPYAVIREFLDVTADDFDRLRAEVGDEAPAGLILHVAGPSTCGWRTIDVFETRAAYQSYTREQLIPALARAGIATRGRTSELAAHHLLHTCDRVARPALYPEQAAARNRAAEIDPRRWS